MWNHRAKLLVAGPHTKLPSFSGRVNLLFTTVYKSFPPNPTLCPSLLPANRCVAGSSRHHRQNVLACLLTLLGLLLPAVEVRTQDLASDKAALAALYDATGGANWTNNTNWLSDEPVGNWHGVTVNNGRVTGLNLAANNLTGTIPSELGNLSSLEELYLSLNQLTGTIPAQLGNLANLELLYLHDNRLTGPLPQNLTSLSLDYFYFDNGTTGLCAPNDTTFQNWLEAIANKDNGPTCSADNYSIPGKITLTYPKAGSNLDDLIARVAAGEIEAEDAAAEAPLHRGDAVAVTLHLSGNVGGVVSFLQSNGVTPRHQGEDYIEAFVPIRLLGTVSQQTGVLRMRMIHPPQEDQILNTVPGNGPPVHIPLPGWNAAGYDGRGIRVGVIDAGFYDLTPLLGDEVPTIVQAMCFNGYWAVNQGIRSPISHERHHCETWIDYAGNERPRSTHGTVVAESVLDMAPGVELLISQPRTRADLRHAVWWMTENGVDVINYSMGWTFDGPGDGTSPDSVSPLEAVDLAVDRGTMWVNSAGNSARTTWFKRGPFTPFVIDFDANDSTNSISLHQGSWIGVELRWDDSWHAASRDLDLCIGNPNTGAILICTNNPQSGNIGDVPHEILWYQAQYTGQHDLVVVRRGGTEPGWIQLRTLWRLPLSTPPEAAASAIRGKASTPAC